VFADQQAWRGGNCRVLSGSRSELGRPGRGGCHFRFWHFQTVSGASPTRRIFWVEEPIRHDDYRGSAEVVDAFDVRVQIGEIQWSGSNERSSHNASSRLRHVTRI
jgi:hypothetical protein